MTTNFLPFAREARMVAKTVNLDALIPRDDFVSDDSKAGGSPRQTISISDLQTNGFFQNCLRKPDFQRETTHWTASAVVDLIRAFLDGDLIPAVILWERGQEIFVIDGAHRLSALIAWIRDDYGDGTASNGKFGSGLTDEQRTVADQTRKLVRNEIGTYAEFAGLLGQAVSDPVKSRRLNSIGKTAVQIQWVTASTAKAAEESFFKINQAAQPIDPIERRILQTRTSPNAIASRCIARGGKGHKYWKNFSSENQEKIEGLGQEIYNLLYKPPHTEPITSADVPIAGQGYNALLFVFNLVSLANGLKIPNSITNKKIDDPLPPDPDGTTTIKFLENVKKYLQTITTDEEGSFGFHPLIYFYAKSGQFLLNAFLASINFAIKLDKEKRRLDFTKVRRRFEDYLNENKLFVTLTIHRLGSGARSLDRIGDLYWKLFEEMHKESTDEEIFKLLVVSNEFVHLKQIEIPSLNATEEPSRKGASKQSKSAAFIREALSNPVRCYICGAAIHKNAITFDHVDNLEEGGSNHSKNLKPVHPYCNSGFKEHFRAKGLALPKIA